MATDTYSTAGTTSWVAPTGVTSVDVECWGAGGGGGSQSQNRIKGGGGGAYSKKLSIAVTPGNSYTVVVGSGGAAGVGNNSQGGTGGDTYFIDISTVLAKGGVGGGPAGALAGGTGGLSASGVGIRSIAVVLARLVKQAIMVAVAAEVRQEQRLMAAVGYRAVLVELVEQHQQVAEMAEMVLSLLLLVRLDRLRVVAVVQVAARRLVVLGLLARLFSLIRLVVAEQ